MTRAKTLVTICQIEWSRSLEYARWCLPKNRCGGKHQLDGTHTIRLHRRFNLPRLGCAVRVKAVTRCKDGVGLHNLYDHYALNFKLIANNTK